MFSDLFKLHDATGVGLLVYAEDGGWGAFLKVLGDRFVGGQHELLDDAVGDVAHGAFHAGHGAEFIELDDGLGEVEIDRATFDALGV